MKKLLLFFAVILPFCVVAQQTEKEITINPLIKGTLFLPEKTDANTKLVILIAGSGPTDRNGNMANMPNNSLKLLAQDIAKNGNAAFSYDKRIFAMAASGNMDEKSLTFDNFIDDAKDVIAYFKATKNYSKIIIAGHSEGSLIGAVAALGNADGLISIAGPGRGIDIVLTEQITAQMPDLKPELEKATAMIKRGETYIPQDQVMSSVFRESVQPYMRSWMKYDPQTEIKKLHIPVLIVNGTKDLQVKVQDAELLKQAKGDATLLIIPNMNHVLKEISGDQSDNMAAYSNPDLPVAKALTEAVNQFIKTI